MPQDLTAYFPEIWAAESLITLHDSYVIARLVHTDFDDAIAKMGDTVNTRQPQTFTASDKAIGSDYTATDLSPTNVQILINKHKYVHFVIEDIESAKSARGMQGILEDTIRPAAKALAAAVDSDLLALYSDISATAGTAGTDLTNTAMIDAMKDLNDAGAPGSMRRGVIASKDHANLLKGTSTNSIFVKADERGDSEGFKEARIGRAYGIDWFMAQGVKTATVSSVLNTYNLVFHRNAFALVTRQLEPIDPRLGALAANMVSEDGLAVRLVITYDGKRGGHRGTLEMVYGVKTLNASLATQLLS